LFVALFVMMRGVRGPAWRRFFVPFFALLILLMVRQQVKAVRPVNDLLAVRSMAALALSLDIKDAEYVGNVYPNADHVLNVAKIAVERRYSVFGIRPYVDLGRQIGKPYALSETAACLGALDRVEPI